MPLILIGLGVLAAIGPAISVGLITTLGVADAIFGIGVSLVISGVGNLIKKTPSAGSVTSTHDMGSRTVSIRQPDAPWRIIFGRARVGGILTFAHFTGTNNEFLHLIYTVAGHQIESFDAINFDGTAVALDVNGDGTGKYAAVAPDTHAFVHCEFNLGSPTQAAFAGLIAAAPDKWSSQHRQAGRAGVYIRLKWSADLFPNGVPNITFDVHGYNQVRDPSVGAPNASYSENPAAVLQAYMTDTSFGLGEVLANIDEANSTLAAFNTSNEAVALAAGGTEPRYTCNGSFTADELPKDVIAGLLSAMSGTIVYADGLWKMYAGAYRGTTLSFGDGDLRGPIRWNVLVSRQNLCNRITGTYVSPLNNWQPSDFPVVTNPTYVAQDDGEVIARDIVLPFTISPATAQRLAKIELERARRQGQGTFQYKLTALQCEVCDVIQVTHPRFGWNAKTLEVVNLQFGIEKDQNGYNLAGVTLTLNETDANVYAWDPATDEQAVAAAPSPLLLETTDISDPAFPLAVSDAFVRADGITSTRIKLTWNAPQDQFVLDGGTIEIQISDHADGSSPKVWKSATPADSVDGASTLAYISNVLDGHTYDVRIRARNVNNVAGQWVEVDNCLVTDTISAIAISTVVAKQGSMRPTTVPVWTLVTNSNNGSGVCTQRYSCPSTVIPLGDGTSITVPATDVSWTSLAGVTTYLRAPRYRISDGTVHWATGTGVNTDADPNTTPLTSGATQAQKDQMAANQNFDGYIPLSQAFLSATTPNNGGTGGGSGGGGGACIHEDELVEIISARGHGILRIADVEVGDLIKGRDVVTEQVRFRRVVGKSSEFCSTWYRVPLRAHTLSVSPDGLAASPADSPQSSGRVMTPCEPVWRGWKWTPANEMQDAEMLSRPGYKIKLWVEGQNYDDHNFCLIDPATGEEMVVHNPVVSS